MLPDCTEGMGPVGTNAPKPEPQPIYEQQIVAFIQEARAECERAIDRAVRDFIRKTGIPECQVRAMWGDVTVVIDGYERKHQDALLTVIL